MRRVWRALTALLVAIILYSQVGCGTIINGSVERSNRGGTSWAALVLNVLFFPPGILVDLISGGFWEDKSKS